MTTDANILLLNRSAPPSEPLQDQVNRCGLTLVHLPLVQAQAIPAPDASMREQIQRSDWLIFCSPRAVEFAQQQLPDIWQLNARFGAVGAGTARRIVQFAPNKPVLIPESGDGANALLQCAELTRLNSQRISLFTGADGLLELGSVLHARGAVVQTVPLYRRVRRTLNPEQQDQCRRARCAYVGSVSFFDALLAVREAQALPVWVPSERVSAHARQHGCTPDLCADSSDAAFITRLKHYRC